MPSSTTITLCTYRQYFEVFEVACSMVFAGLLFWQFGNRLIGVRPLSLGDQREKDKKLTKFADKYFASVDKRNFQENYRRSKL